MNGLPKKAKIACGEQRRWLSSSQFWCLMGIGCSAFCTMRSSLWGTQGGHRWPCHGGAQVARPAVSSKVVRLLDRVPATSQTLDTRFVSRRSDRLGYRFGGFLILLAKSTSSSSLNKKFYVPKPGTNKDTDTLTSKSPKEFPTLCSLPSPNC